MAQTPEEALDEARRQIRKLRDELIEKEKGLLEEEEE